MKSENLCGYNKRGIFLIKKTILLIKKFITVNYWKN